jgi:hypothetical protein
MLLSMKPKTLFPISIPKYLLLILAGLSFAPWAHAGEGVRYTTYLSKNDHYNSNGERLRSVPDILRQDRANYHKGTGDRSDEDDEGIFATTEGRAKFEYYAIILQGVRAASLIAEPQRVWVEVKGRRIYVGTGDDGDE